MKKLYFVFILMVLFLSVTSVSASDFNQSENSNDGTDFNIDDVGFGEDLNSNNSIWFDEIYGDANNSVSNYISLEKDKIDIKFTDSLYYNKELVYELFNSGNVNYSVLDEMIYNGNLMENQESQSEIIGPIKIPTFEEWLNDVDNGCNDKFNPFQLFFRCDNLEKYYGDSKKLNVQCLLEDAEIIFYINDVKYNRYSVNKTASLAVNLNSGEYDAYIFSPVIGNGIKRTIKILPTIISDNLIKYYKNQSQFEVKLFDSEGNTLNSSNNVTFNINGVFYTRQVNDEGIARLNINLAPGQYVITTINNVTGEKIANNVTVLSYIESSDLIKYYKNDSQFIIKVFNKTSGNVTFNINGVFYTRQINQTGHAKLNINLAPGEYIITSIFGDCVNSNNITVLSRLAARDLEMSQRDGSKFLVKLLDGEGNRLAGENVTFNVNGVFYNRTTDSNGIARLNINLGSGNYIISSMHGDSTISNNIKIDANPKPYYYYIPSHIRRAIYDNLNDIDSIIESFAINNDSYYVYLANPEGYQIGFFMFDENGTMLDKYFY